MEEVVTSGTGTFRDALAHAGLAARPVLHTVGPGTLVYGDLMSAATLADMPGHAPSVAVLARVVSRSDSGRATLDAGSKALSVDQGVPHCAVVSRPWLEPLKPSEEHLPLHVTGEHATPAVGEVLAVIPKHVCTTVQLHDRALLVADGRSSTTCASTRAAASCRSPHRGADVGRVVHFELHAADPDRARLFYEEVFGWEVTRVGVMPYWLVRTGPEDETGIDGGIVQRRGSSPPSARR